MTASLADLAMFIDIILPADQDNVQLGADSMNFRRQRFPGRKRNTIIAEERFKCKGVECILEWTFTAAGIYGEKYIITLPCGALSGPMTLVLGCLPNAQSTAILLLDELLNSMGMLMILGSVPVPGQNVSFL